MNRNTPSFPEVITRLQEIEAFYGNLSPTEDVEDTFAENISRTGILKFRDQLVTIRAKLPKDTDGRSGFRSGVITGNFQEPLVCWRVNDGVMTSPSIFLKVTNLQSIVYDVRALQLVGSSEPEDMSNAGKLDGLAIKLRVQKIQSANTVEIPIG
jgi:hypothetical protein